MSLAQTAGLIIVAEYFEKRKALAMSLATFGSGLGALAFPPLMWLFFEDYGYQGAFLIIGALCLHNCVSAALFRPLECSTDTFKQAQLLQNCTDPPDSDKQKKRFICCQSENTNNKTLFDFSLLRKLQFDALCLVNFSVGFTISLVSGFIPALAKQVGIDPEKVGSVFVGICILWRIL